MVTYRVDVRHGERWWVLEVPEVPGAVSQSRTLRDVEATARDVIALMLDVEPDSFGVDVHVELPESVTSHLARSATLREQAADAQAGAAAEVRAAARDLAGRGVTVRDIGAALGVSHQRAHQLVNS